MGRPQETRFQMRGRTYSADAVAALVPKEDGVEVRYSDGKPSTFIHNATVERVTYAIDKAKADADSA